MPMSAEQVQVASMSSIDHYKTKAVECRERAATALTPREKDDWLKLAAEWEAMVFETDPSGFLPWDVKVG